MTGKIYFVQIGGNGPIKVGFAKCPVKRMGSLQCACPWKLRLIGAIAGIKPQERWLHEKFSPFKMLGEWFGPEILPEVERFLSVGFSWPKSDSALDRAIAVAGSQIELGMAAGISPPSISLARKRGMSAGMRRRVESFLSERVSA